MGSVLFCHYQIWHNMIYAYVIRKYHLFNAHFDIWRDWQLAWTHSYCLKIIFLLGQAFPNPMYILVLIKASYIVCSRKTWKMFIIIRKIIIRKTIIRKIISKTWRMFAIIPPLSPAPTDCFAIVLPLEKVSRPLNVQQL